MYCTTYVVSGSVQLCLAAIQCTAISTYCMCIMCCVMGYYDGLP